ncbi:MAG: hypothetical protein ACRCZB_00290, partial [Bacteroidales bacterium]
MRTNQFFSKRMAMFFALHLSIIAAAFGQGYGQTPNTVRGMGADTTAFSVLWNNADLDNNKLFVEIMYDRKTCFQDAAEFWLCKDADGEHPFNSDAAKRGRQVPIDSILNNKDNCVISEDLLTLSQPTAGGYRLRFQLDPTKGDTVVANKVRIYVVS